jgi:transposase-like protein
LHRPFAFARRGQYRRPVRGEGIVQNLYYRWSKEFLEAGKKRLAGDTARAATSDEVKELRREASALKEVVAELTQRAACCGPAGALVVGRTVAPGDGIDEQMKQRLAAMLGRPAIATSPLVRSRSRAAQTLRIQWPGWCVPDALSAPAVRVVSDCRGTDPQLIPNRRALPPQKSLLSQRFQKLSVSGWTLV